MVDVWPHVPPIVLLAQTEFAHATAFSLPQILPVFVQPINSSSTVYVSPVVQRVALLLMELVLVMASCLHLDKHAHAKLRSSISMVDVWPRVPPIVLSAQTAYAHAITCSQQQMHLVLVQPINSSSTVNVSPVAQQTAQLQARLAPATTDIRQSEEAAFAKLRTCFSTVNVS